MPPFVIRPYRPSDLPGLRAIYGDDEFARPRLLARWPRFGEYLADEVLTYYVRCEPENLVVAEAGGEVIGALLGCAGTRHYDYVYAQSVRPFLRRRLLGGAYGWPGWLPSVLRTEWAGRNLQTPDVDLGRYPAHLHIGLLPACRRQGIGTALMARFEENLQAQGVPGYHLYAASFHPLGLAFYRKLGLEELGRFNWRLHDGLEWRLVTETIFARSLA